MNRSFAGRAVAAVAVLLATSVAAPAQDDPKPRPAAPARAHLLRYTFLPETAGAYTAKFTVIQHVGRRGQEIAVELTLGYRLLETTARGARVEQRIRRIVASMEFQNRATRWDSAGDDAPPPLFRPMLAALDKTFVHGLDTRGRITDVESPMAVQEIGFDLERVMRQAIPILPETPVTVGGSWIDVKRTHLPNGVDVDVAFEHRFTGLDGKLVQMQLTMEPVATDQVPRHGMGDARGVLTVALDRFLPEHAMWRYDLLEVGGRKLGTSRFEVRHLEAK